MREIKFRAWDKKLKVWTTPYYFNDVKDKIQIFNLFDDSKRNRIEVMQFTGLKDKNGKEIFEGDILKYPSGIIEVKWIGVGMYNICILMDNASKKQQEYLIKEFKECEVIGNKFENPDLLK